MLRNNIDRREFCSTCLILGQHYIFEISFENNFTLVLKRVLICMAHVLWNESCLQASTLISCAILIQHDLESQLSSPRVLTHAFVEMDHVLKISWRCGWHSQRQVYFSLKMRLCWLAVYKCHLMPVIEWALLSGCDMFLWRLHQGKYSFLMCKLWVWYICKRQEYEWFRTLYVEGRCRAKVTTFFRGENQQ